MHRTAAHHRSRVASARRAEPLEIAVVVLIIVALFVAAALPAIRRAVADRREPRVFSSVRVRAGESVWQLAKTHPVPGYSTAELVDVIVRENGIDDALVAGDVVRLPARELNDAAVCQR